MRSAYLVVIIPLLLLAQQKEDPLKVGMKYFDKGRLQEAERCLVEALKTHPQEKMIYYRLGQIYYHWERWDEAKERLMKVIQLDSLFFKAYYYLGMIHLYQKDWEKAERLFYKALSLNENYAEVYNGLGLVYSSRPKSKIYTVESIKRMFKQDDLSKAIRFFEKALEIAPNYLEARLNLGKACLQRADKASLLKAKDAFAEIIKTTPGYDDVYFHLARTYHGLREFSNAIAVLRDIIRLHPGHSRAKIELAQIYFQLGQGQVGSKYYMDGVEGLRDESVLEELYQQVIVIATEEEKREYKNSPLEKKGAFLKRFWLKRDPDLTTEANERLVEHYRRLQYARIHFPAKTPRGYDDRGLIYIKYGEPDERFVSSVNLGEPTKGNETWIYRGIGEGLSFDFVEEGGVYHLARDLSEAVASGGSKHHRLLQTGRLYRERAHLDPRYAAIAAAIEKATSITQYQMAELELNVITSEKFKAIKEAPPEKYDPIRRENLLTLANRMAQFKGRGDSTRVEFYYGVFNNQLDFKPYFSKGYRTFLFSSVAVYDSLYNPVKKEDKRISLKVSSQQEASSNVSVNQEVILLPPGEYNFTFHLENKEKIGLYRTDLKVRDFSGDSLKISDIQFAFDIKPARPGDRFVKNGLKITPFPFPNVKKKSPLFIYYEIYNLKLNPSGKSKYRVEYNVKTIREKRRGNVLTRIFTRGKKGSISTLFERQGQSTTSIEYTSFDLKKLPPGTCQLTVAIKDLNSGEEAWSVITFELEE